jgi:hypothetical protein
MAAQSANAPNPIVKSCDLLNEQIRENDGVLSKINKLHRKVVEKDKFSMKIALKLVEQYKLALANIDSEKKYVHRIRVYMLDHG